MYQTGYGWVPDELVANAPVLTLFQNPGAEEEAVGQPTVGKTGQWIARHLHPPAGLMRGENVSIANVLKCRWRGGNALPPEPVLTQAIAHCTRAHLKVPSEVQVVVACGEVAQRVTGARIIGAVQAWDLADA